MCFFLCQKALGSSEQHSSSNCFFNSTILVLTWGDLSCSSTLRVYFKSFRSVSLALALSTSCTVCTIVEILRLEIYGSSIFFVVPSEVGTEIKYLSLPPLSLRDP